MIILEPAIEKEAAKISTRIKLANSIASLVIVPLRKNVKIGQQSKNIQFSLKLAAILNLFVFLAGAPWFSNFFQFFL